MSGRMGLSGLAAAALALAAGSHGTSLGGVMEGRPRASEIDWEYRRERRLRVKRGPAPKPSKEMSDDYRLSVRAQRGFTSNRLQALRRDWLKHCAQAKRDHVKPTEWWNFLEAARATPLELQFARQLFAA